jgi:hypothetical protein
MIFAKDQGDSLASLVKQVDKLVADNTDKEMKAFVNFIGEDREELEEKATKFAEPYANVPIVVPVEFELGPKDFNVHPDAGVTVMIYKGAKVVANHAVAPDKLDEKAIEAIIKDTGKILE